MNKKVRHLLGISGGKDSAALAIYLRNKYPELDIEYYTCDTGKELTETYELIEKLESYLGKKITRLMAADQSSQDPFDHFYHIYGGYLPSSNARWCTKKLKLEPFEKFIGDDIVVSYVGIRGDEDREGYISTKPNVQSIFPFRKNIWSENLIQAILSPLNGLNIIDLYKSIANKVVSERAIEIIQKPLSSVFTKEQKLNALLSLDIKAFNRVVFDWIKEELDYPLSNVEVYPLIDNDEILVRADIFRLLEESGVGVPQYYEKIEFEVGGKIGEYARSRSGCYFCFFQQKIEWVWLLEQHPDLFNKAIQYENAKDGFTWNQHESLEQLSQPERVAAIKKEYINRSNRTKIKSPYLLDILDDAESEGCAACFI